MINKIVKTLIYNFRRRHVCNVLAQYPYNSKNELDRDPSYVLVKSQITSQIYLDIFFKYSLCFYDLTQSNGFFKLLQKSIALIFTLTLQSVNDLQVNEHFMRCKKQIYLWKKEIRKTCHGSDSQMPQQFYQQS